MKTVLKILAALLLLSCLADAESNELAEQSPAELKAGIEKKHPAAYYMLAAKLFQNAATKEEAVFWFYVGQIRYRYYLAANPDLPPDGDPAVFTSFAEVIGRPINEYAGGVPDVWIAQMNRALEWDATHDNGFTPKTKSPEKYRQVRAGLVALRDRMAAMKDKIPELRRKNGLQ